MQAAVAFEASPESSWRVTREGAIVAAVDVRHEGGDIVVVAGPLDGPTKPKPYRFPTLQAADEFLSDLMLTFAYLGCEVAQS